MDNFAAPSHTLTDITSLPWWAQLAIGVGLMVLAVFLEWFTEDRSAFIRIARTVLEIAGLLIVLNVLL